MSRARFSAELEGEDLIVVVDRNLPDTRSVTNDAERVVATIAEFVTIGNRQIVYRDSGGRWDGILVRNGALGAPVFGGFFAIGATDRTAAIEGARRFLNSRWT